MSAALTFPSLFPACRGFTPYLREDYLEWKREGRLVNDGVNAKVRSWACKGMLWTCLPAHCLANVGTLHARQTSLTPPLHQQVGSHLPPPPPFFLSFLPQLLDNHGPLDARAPGQIFESAPRLWSVPVHVE